MGDCSSGFGWNFSHDFQEKVGRSYSSIKVASASVVGGTVDYMI